MSKSDNNPFLESDSETESNIWESDPFSREEYTQDGHIFDVNDQSRSDQKLLSKPSPVLLSPYSRTTKEETNSFDIDEHSYVSSQSAGPLYAPEECEKGYDDYMQYYDQTLNKDTLMTFQRRSSNDDIQNYDLGAINIQPDQAFESNITNFGTKKVQPLNGEHFIFDYSIPNKLLDHVPDKLRQLNEFKSLRYHAITTEPNDPNLNEYIDNYPLRPKVYTQPRETELLIVITMYNEDDMELARTLKGVFENINMMRQLSENPDVHPFGNDSWQKIVVAIVSDGKNKINGRTKALLTALGCFQEGLMQQKVNDQDVKAHLFEYTTTLGIGGYNKKGTKQEIPLIGNDTGSAVQIMFLLKEENKQKINSHRWAFNFLCPILNPKVVCLLDVGTEPGYSSLYKLWSAFKDPQVAGACGEIRVLLGTDYHIRSDDTAAGKLWKYLNQKGSDLLLVLKNPLVAAQNFEYKMSNILDKPTESAFGFISVLPGAFSAYRYLALEGEPLEKYFYGEDMKDPSNKKPAGVFESNMYLAEDRILCYELVTKTNCSYVLKYVHDAYAYTDVPSKLPEFIKQRRRWLNGSFFASVYSSKHFFRIFQSNHSGSRKFVLSLEMLYQLINAAVSWLSVSFYFIVFRVLSIGVVNAGYEFGNILAIVFLWIYIFLLCMTFILSFGNKPDHARFMYTTVFYFFGVLMLYMCTCVVLITVKYFQVNGSDLTDHFGSFANIILAIISTYALYVFGSLMFAQFFHLMFCFAQYYFLSPAYINFLTVYAFCNIHDISWGTKGETKVDTKNSVTKDSTGYVLSNELENPAGAYDEACKLLLTEVEETKVVLSTRDKSEANFAKGRTYTVILWLLCNFAVLVSVLQTGGIDDYKDLKSSHSSSSILKREINQATANRFMTVILYLVAVLALVRVIGVIIYRIEHFKDSRKFHKSLVF